MKTCTKCGVTKPRTEFYRMAATRDGLRPNCKACAQAYNAARVEAVAEYNREYRQRNADRLREYDTYRYERMKAQRIAARLATVRVVRRERQEVA